MRAANVGPASVPGRNAFVNFELTDSTEEVIAEKWAAENVNGNAPVRFLEHFSPFRPWVPAGGLTWTVLITDDGKYNDGAHAYGVSETYPFRVSLPLRVPRDVSPLWVQSIQKPDWDVAVGDVATFTVGIGNNGSQSRYTSMEWRAPTTLYVEPQPERPYFINPGGPRSWRFNLTPLAPGVSTFSAWFNSTVPGDESARTAVEFRIEARPKGDDRLHELRGCGPDSSDPTAAIFELSESEAFYDAVVCQTDAAQPRQLRWDGQITHGTVRLRVLDLGDGTEIQWDRLPAFAENESVFRIERPSIVEVRGDGAVGTARLTVDPIAETRPSTAPVPAPVPEAEAQDVAGLSSAPADEARSRNWLVVAALSVVIGAAVSWWLSRRFGP